MDSLSLALATRGIFQAGTSSFSESLSDKRSPCERVDELPALERTSAMSEDNDFDMWRKPSTMLSEIESLRLSMKSFFATDVVFEELG